MRRSPFYAYPNFPHSFYAPPAEAPYHRPHRPFDDRPSPAPTPRSVISIPVFDSSPSWPSSLPLQPHPMTPPAAVSLIDPSSAATTIQSCFRGFCVRRHRPLLHLRSIAKARKQLEELQVELESPGFSLKLRASEKERLRLSESVMAIILGLDAIEGSLAEVRSQRKEATKTALKLQDDIDAIMIQGDDIDELKPTDTPVPDVCMALDNDSVQCEQSEEPLCPDVNTLRHGVALVQEESTSLGAEKCMLNLDNNDDVMDTVVDIVSSLPPLMLEDAGQQVEAGGEGEHSISDSGCFESSPQFKAPEGMHDAEQGLSHVTGEYASSDATPAAEEEVNNGIDGLRLEAHNNQMQGNALVTKESMQVAPYASTKGAFSEGPYMNMDVVQGIKEGFNRDVELCPGTPTAEEKCDHPHFSNAVHHVELQGQSTALERLTEGNSCSHGPGSPTLHTHGYENCSDEVYEILRDVANPRDAARAQPSTLSVAGAALPPPDGAVLDQLSEDCKQLRSLVGKLLVQNKAQSKVLSALGERLELLEHQQHLNCQRNQQQMREKRKLKKGSKRSVKCRN